MSNTTKELIDSARMILMVNPEPGASWEWNEQTKKLRNEALGFLDRAKQQMEADERSSVSLVQSLRTYRDEAEGRAAGLKDAVGILADKLADR